MLCNKNTVNAECAVTGINWKSRTCGHKVSMWLAAICTIFVPSSFVDNEQARLATLNKQSFVSMYSSPYSQTFWKYLCKEAFVI